VKSGKKNQLRPGFLQERFMRQRIHAVMIVLVLIAGCAGLAGERHGTIERLYVFNCGESRVEDVSRWTPGVNVGKPWEFSANCYLIQHAKGRMMWDAGINDNVATMPQGFQRSKVAPRYRLPKPLRFALAEISVDPAKVEHVAFSHTHGDHIGNANLFTGATLYIQQAEYDVAFGRDAASKWNFEVTSYDKLRANKTVKLNGDHDVFGDGSVVIISTPGHTPGHQSLLVRLPKTGPVILSGDVVHLQDNWVHRRVPSFNFDREQSLKSMEKVAGIMERTGAKLWINHDKAQSDKIPKAPAYVE
jgi:glyoxylase-like metal-dependent hydrolase (beta-lactamase superfamily II)